MATRRDFQRPSAVSLGRDAEARALAFLEQQGLTLIEKNFRCRTGEIDLIMHDAQTLVFIEVRSRKDRRFGGAGPPTSPASRCSAGVLVYHLQCALLARRLQLPGAGGHGHDPRVLRRQ